MKDFKYLKSNMKEISYLLIMIVSFLVLSHFTGWFVGGVSYLIIALIINVIFNRKEIMEIINVAFKR